MSGRMYTFDTTDHKSPCCNFQWYIFRKQGESRIITCELFGVIVSLENRWDWLEFMIDDSLQLTAFRCPKRDKLGMETLLQLGDVAQVTGNWKLSNGAFLNATKIAIHNNPDVECKYWLQQIQKYKSKVCELEIPSDWIRRQQRAHNLKTDAVLSFSAQVSTAAATCWKLWKKHFNQGGKISLQRLWEVIQRENCPKMQELSSCRRNQIVQLLIHLGYLIPLSKEPETYVLLIDDILDKQVMQIFNQNIASKTLSLREVAYRLEEYFHVEEISLERVEESILRLAYKEKVEQV
ncbi:uncharacterized protein Gasu_33640 [Galdieria sulphuraria]|uniref:CST complex subunit Stn1 N-terminal domain-containing protein n=1 Tax=Galdieria sulphuraria TaxID=130081 RepID=M2W0M2_GALSU|nr:uncharacterized protein Gasu_33640 [Galdieria sulphuraria]EME29161.1 hypothetical protein Gasu_33640 [Galdieria sulphuraria]|eukprot:XP_005705681.1 hypothetical protein Gasu_33640 [Galdieria sulphuraria]